jgi:hypothetical protein
MTAAVAPCADTAEAQGQGRFGPVHILSGVTGSHCSGSELVAAAPPHVPLRVFTCRRFGPRVPAGHPVPES